MILISIYYIYIYNILLIQYYNSEYRNNIASAILTDTVIFKFLDILIVGFLIQINTILNIYIYTI